MSVERNSRRQTAYRDSVYVQGNTARKLQVVQAYEQPRTQKKVSTRTRRNRERALHMNIRSVLSLAIPMVVGGLILMVYLNLQSDITNSTKNIATLESRLNTLKMDNDENYSRINSSVDLEEVKRIAIQELGMRYAEEGQIIRFNGEGSDYIRQTGSIPE